MAKKNNIPDIGTEQPADAAPRDLATEIAIAQSHIDKLKERLDEKEYENSQLQDIARMNTAGKLLPMMLEKYGLEAGIDKAIDTADRFVAHYVEIMEKNAREYMRKVQQQAAGQGETEQ